MERCKVYIDKIVNGGYGMASSEGRVVLVPFAVPGDLLKLKPMPSERGSGKRELFCEIETIVKPSSMRVEPRCPVFGMCGGCDFDHIPYQYELEVKKGILLEDLQRMGNLSFEKEIETHPSPSEYGYRNHAQVKVNTLGKMGFFKKRSHEIIPLPSQGCLLLRKAIKDFVLDIETFQPLQEGSIRIRANEEGQVFCRGVPNRDDDEYAYYNVADHRFRIGVDDFFQVNSYLNERWIELVKRYVDPGPEEVICDLFCGSGLIALSLAPFSRRVTGIEGNGSGVRNARYNASLNGVQNAEFMLGDLTTQTDISRWETGGQGCIKVVVDPPRTGLDRRLIDSITKLEPAVVVYASCNSATFARDVKEFVARGYRPDAISMIDMFPRTRHIETVSRFVK